MSCHVGVTAGARQSTEIEKARAFIRWKGGGTSELSESELRAYIASLDASRTAVSKELRELVDEFGKYSQRQRD